MATHGPANPINPARQRVLAMETKGIRDCRRSVLLAMLDYLNPPGQQTIEGDIHGCDDEEELMELADHYISAVLKPMKAHGGKTPLPTPSPNFAAEEDARQLEQSAGPSQTRISTRAAERLCLPRDGYRCVVTNFQSANTPTHLLPPGTNHTQTTMTQTCHIIPLSLAQYGDLDQDRNNACRTWASLCRMFPGLRSRIADHLENINHPSNLFTAMTLVHEVFGNFNLAFEQQPGGHTYRVHTWQHVAAISTFLPPNRIIQFTNHSNTNTSLPDPYLLEIHYTIAQIMHASGLAEILDQVIDDYYSLGGLAVDGSTNLPFFIEAC